VVWKNRETNSAAVAIFVQADTDPLKPISGEPIGTKFGTAAKFVGNALNTTINS
jgi:hypothetical protein